MELLFYRIITTTITTIIIITTTWMEGRRELLCLTNFRITWQDIPHFSISNSIFYVKRIFLSTFHILFCQNYFNFTYKYDFFYFSLEYYILKQTITKVLLLTWFSLLSCNVISRIFHEFGHLEILKLENCCFIWQYSHPSSSNKFFLAAETPYQRKYNSTLDYRSIWHFLAQTSTQFNF